jgi:hypothetical protein
MNYFSREDLKIRRNNRHPGESRDLWDDDCLHSSSGLTPIYAHGKIVWVPAFAGMTELFFLGSSDLCVKKESGVS